MSSRQIAAQLGRTGLCVWPNFLSAENLADVGRDFDFLQQEGVFQRAGIGQGAEREVQDLRRDEIHWLDRSHTNGAQSGLWRKLDELKSSLNRDQFLGLDEFEGHYASYAPGGFYRRHRDSFHHDSSRKISVVIYLNRDWQPSHGGRLRIYDSTVDPETHSDVDPVGGTLVCFLSQVSEHEVMETHHSRRSFTGWFKTRE